MGWLMRAHIFSSEGTRARHHTPQHDEKDPHAREVGVERVRDSGSGHPRNGNEGLFLRPLTCSTLQWAVTKK